MVTGFRGTFVISWTQTELDGLASASPNHISVGATWRWYGQAVKVDDRRDVLLLEKTDSIADIHRRAAHQVRRFLGDPVLPSESASEQEPDEPLFRSGFEVTDGRDRYQATLISIENGHHPMILFVGKLPPANQDLWIVACSMGADMAVPDVARPATICFVPGTTIMTPNGERLIEDLAEGDEICTKDSGVQAIRWIGNRNITGGRLMAMPFLRPVRVAAHVFADGEPDKDLIVSPDHRVLVKGAVAQSLFNTPEVLVAARDLINDATIRPDRRCRGVSYVHLMLDKHEIVWANGVEVESFHPAGASPDQIDPAQHRAMLERFPGVEDDASSYGEFARRNLTRSEAAVLSHGLFAGH